MEVSIFRPLGYEPNALPLRQSDTHIIIGIFLYILFSNIFMAPDDNSQKKILKNEKPHKNFFALQEITIYIFLYRLVIPWVFSGVAPFRRPAFGGVAFGGVAFGDKCHKEYIDILLYDITQNPFFTTHSND